MKTIIIILAVLSTTAAVAQQASGTDPVPITNISIVKSPIIMKGIYGARIPGGQRYANANTTDAAVLRALRMFKSTQNEDGSWGEGCKRRLATPLVLMALLGHGESSASLEFGNTVARAHEWTLAARPTNDAERIETVLALSEYVALHVGNRRDLAAADIAKIKTCLSAVQSTTNNPWVDYATFYRLPQEVPRPDRLKYTREYPARWADAEVDIEPENIPGYLALRVAGLGKFQAGGNHWKEFNRQFAPKMIDRQTDAGFLPCKPDSERFACTALAVQAMEVYYQYRPNSWAQPVSEEEELADDDIEINITQMRRETQNKTSEHISEGRKRPSENAQR